MKSISSQDIVTDMGTFAADLKRARRHLGMSQSQFAEALSVHANTVARWERGELSPRMRGAILALVATLKPIPKSQRRPKKGGRPRGGKNG